MKSMLLLIASKSVQRPVRADGTMQMEGRYASRYDNLAADLTCRSSGLGIE